MVGKKEVLQVNELRALPMNRMMLACWRISPRRWPGSKSSAGSDAAGRFELVLADHPTDGPARFYLERCRLYLSLATVPAEPAVIRLERK